MTENNALTEAREYNAYHLASMVGVLDPDSLESPGAEFLTGVRDAVLSDEALEQIKGNSDPQDSLTELAEADVYSSTTYTHKLWTIFVDLGLYSWDDEYDSPKEDLTEMARGYAYQVANQLAHQLWSEVEDEVMDDGEEEDEDGEEEEIPEGDAEEIPASGDHIRPAKIYYVEYSIDFQTHGTHEPAFIDRADAEEIAEQYRTGPYPVGDLYSAPEDVWIVDMPLT